MKKVDVKILPRSFTFDEKTLGTFAVSEEAFREMQDRLIDHMDAQLAARMGVPAPFPSRELKRRISRMKPKQRAEFDKVLDIVTQHENPIQALAFPFRPSDSG